MANKSGKHEKSDVDETIAKLKTVTKIAAVSGLSVAMGAADAVSSGAKVFKKAAAKAREGLQK